MGKLRRVGPDKGDVRLRANDPARAELAWIFSLKLVKAFGSWAVSFR
jgi:hypothetical protein